MYHEINSILKEIANLREKPNIVLHSNGGTGIIRGTYIQLYEMLREQERLSDIDIIVYSYGGDIHSTYKICRLLKRKTRRFTVIVPHFAKSAATLLSIAANKIILAPKAELGPLDAQVPDPRDTRNTISALDSFKSLEFLRTYAIETMDITVRFLLERGLTIDEATQRGIEMVDKICNPLFCQLEPLVMGENERILGIAEQYGSRLLKDRMNEDQANSLLDRIIKRYPSHSFVIDKEELDDLGIDCTESDEVLTTLLESLDDKLMQLDNPYTYYTVPEERGNGEEE